MPELPIESIVRNPDQPRQTFDPEQLQELANSILANGLIVPISVRDMRDGTYQIVHGERRWRACTLAGLETIRAEIVDFNDRDAYIASVVENEVRENLSPIETARALRRLKDDHGLTDSAIAKRIGRNREWVTNKLRLLGLPDTVQTAMADGNLTESHARQLLKLHRRGEDASDLAKQAATEAWSVSELESAVNVRLAGDNHTPVKTAILYAADPEKSARAIRESFTAEEIAALIHALSVQSGNRPFS